MHVLDLGGTVQWWSRAPVRPERVVVINLETDPHEPSPWLTVRHGDACALPHDLQGERFDIVISNSLLEHVGGHARRRMLADAIHGAAPRHWVQTPYRYFPIEPHWLFPGFQFLPVAARAAVYRRWPLVHTAPADRQGSLRSVLETELIGIAELEYLFPDSTILRERFGPLTKSIVAVAGRGTSDRGSS